MNKSRNDRIFDAINTLLLIVLVLIIVYPLYFTVIASFSEPVDVAEGKVIFLPSGFTLDAYKEVFKNSEVWVGYRNTIVYTVAGTVLSLMLTIPAAYVLSKKQLVGRGFISLYFVFTMFFDAGIISNYMVVRSTGIMNTMWAIVLPGSINVWYMIIMRTFFADIPEELFESA